VVRPVFAGLTAHDGKQDLNEMRRGTRGRGEGMSEWVLKLVARFRNEKGQALAEYSLILAFIAAASVLALGALGLALGGHLDALAAAFP
jgi:Flp pilus assembly pilin Flp